jgi:magnesium chelatase subunit D
LLAVDPARFGGVHLRAQSSSARTAWLEHLHMQLPAGTPWLRVPAGADADALLGGLDLTATLACGRPVSRRGLLARAHGGFLVLGMAERASALVLACLQQALDEGEVHLEREGQHAREPARFGLIVLDEGLAEDEVLPDGLLDRLAFALDGAALERWQQAGNALSRSERLALDELRVACSAELTAARDEVPEATVRFDLVASDNAAAADLAKPTDGRQTAEAPIDHDDALGALCMSAWQLGILSLRPPIQALAVAQACATAAGRDTLCQDDLVLAGTLVFSARARQQPASAPPAEGPPPESTEPEGETAPESSGESPQEPADPATAQTDTDQQTPPSVTPPGVPSPESEQLVDSVLAALPPDVLARLSAEAAGQGSGRVNAPRRQRARPARHGRPIGSQPGDPRRGQALDLLGTLRAALPWQRLRRHAPTSGARLSIRTSDLQVRRLKPRTRSTAVFAVDASGSAALNRLNEAKGAVESLLAQCYVRRDQVALISFRGPGAKILLPPTRSLTRVRRELSALPGGGGTPLASGIELAGGLAGELRRKGDAPLLVLLTDGRANVSRDGIGGRALAEQEAFAAASVLRAERLPALLVDIAPQPQERARLLAEAMGAEYLALPAVSAERLAAAVHSRMPAAERLRG